jgi:catechol 2,3-dioxygenase-like lactoylglutathione lyase family enzyme
VLRVDHVVRAVVDLDDAAAQFRDGFGLLAVDGGTHPRWGTANRLVPLGEACYLELVAVVDAAIADGSTFGRAIGARAASGDAWFAVCLASDDIEGRAAELGLAVEPGSRRLPDGRTISWRGAGVEAAARSPDVPFFIAWDVAPDLHPGAIAPAHPCGATGIARIEVSGSPDRWRSWVGAADGLPIDVAPGPAEVRAVVLASTAGELTIR